MSFAKRVSVFDRVMKAIVVISVLLFFVVMLSGCGGTTDTPLPVIHPDDPTIQLQPDHLDYGALPK